MAPFVSQIEEDIAKITQQVPLTTEEIREAFQQALQECSHERVVQSAVDPSAAARGEGRNP